MKARNTPKNPTQFPGISRDAEALGVTRTHLWLVLSGRRQSRRLMRRYKLLKEEAQNGNRPMRRSGKSPTKPTGEKL